MSNQGSDFRDRYLHEPSAKRAKLSNANAIDPASGVLRLHTEWVQRDTADRVASCESHGARATCSTHLVYLLNSNFYKKLNYCARLPKSHNFQGPGVFGYL